MEKEILHRLEQFLLEKGWNKAEFARQMEMFPQHVARYFDGRSDLQKLFIKLIQKGCDIHWLVTGVRSNDFGCIANENNKTNIITIYEPQKIESEIQLTESVSQNSEQDRVAELEKRIVELEAENRVQESMIDKLIAAKSETAPVQPMVDYSPYYDHTPLRVAEPATRFSVGKGTETK